MENKEWLDILKRQDRKKDMVIIKCVVASVVLGLLLLFGMFKAFHNNSIDLQVPTTQQLENGIDTNSFNIEPNNADSIDKIVSDDVVENITKEIEKN